MNDTRWRPSRLRSRREPSAHFGPVIVLIVGTLVAFDAYYRRDKVRPQPPAQVTASRAPQAVHPLDPWTMAAELASAAAARGDNAATQRHVNEIDQPFTRSIRLPDASCPIDHESARAAISPLPGVRSATWTDHENLLVKVEGAEYRNAEMIDRICIAIDPLGDTLAIVVNVQDVASVARDDAATLSRNCQPAEGERALF